MNTQGTHKKHTGIAGKMIPGEQDRTKTGGKQGSLRDRCAAGAKAGDCASHTPPARVQANWVYFNMESGD